MDLLPIWLPVAFFFIALFYATLGFAGGSAYLAVLALTSLPYQAIPQTALICNLLVSSGGVWHFHRGGHFDFRRLLPFMVLAIPLAYLGGRLEVGERFFTALLGVSLFAAGVRAFLPIKAREVLRDLSMTRAWLIGLPAGGVLGFLAGVVGIGGGIFLAPVLLLTGLATPKRAAAAASLFILLNSAAGLLGHVAKGIHLNGLIFPLGIAVLLGGQIGSRIGSYHIPARGLQRLLAGLIVVVSLRLIWGAI